VTTLNQRLDQMAPNYRLRSVYSQLYRVMAIIEDRANSNPPSMEPGGFSGLHKMISEALNELAKICHEVNDPNAPALK